jgi:hypothetical protein
MKQALVAYVAAACETAPHSADRKRGLQRIISYQFSTYVDLTRLHNIDPLHMLGSHGAGIRQPHKMPRGRMSYAIFPQSQKTFSSNLHSATISKPKHTLLYLKPSIAVVYSGNLYVSNFTA